MMNRDRIWPAAIVVWALVAAMVTVGGQASGYRQVILFSFMLLCPGLAFVPMLGVRGFLAQLAVVIALSIALDVLVAETMALAHAWSLLPGVAVLVCLTTAGALVQLRRAGPMKGGQPL